MLPPPHLHVTPSTLRLPSSPLTTMTVFFLVIYVCHHRESVIVSVERHQLFVRLLTGKAFVDRQLLGLSSLGYLICIAQCHL